ncbi:MAG: phage holin family protein [Alicyclobacillaceae bacterium]|nr:phage holin family protein [Alicyclobacillaceae bacterium]
MRWIVHLVINALALLLAARWIQGIHVRGFGAAIVAALILGLVNTFIRPVLMFFTLPLNILTLGLFTFVINGLLFYAVGHLVQGFEVRGFWAAILGSLLVTVVSYVLNKLVDIF